MKVKRTRTRIKRIKSQLVFSADPIKNRRVKRLQELSNELNIEVKQLTSIRNFSII